jgi:uncharacterized membrane protein
MSFNTEIKKPKLVENKLIKYFNEKKNQKELKTKLAEEVLQKKNLEIEANNIPVEPIYKKLLNPVWEIIKENYGFFMIITLIIILLYVRYIEVCNRKNKMKDVINRINQNQEEINLQTNDF